MMKTTTFLLVLVAAIALVSGADNSNQLRRGSNNNNVVVEMENSLEEAPSDRRQLVSWFSMLFLLGPKMNCDKPRPHGPLGHKWDHDCSSSSSSSSNSDGGTTTTTTQVYDAETDTYISSESAVEDNDQSSSGTNARQNATLNSGSWWPLAVAGVAATVAIAAMIVGQRRGVTNPHPMQGSVARRKGAFENFADRALCDQSKGVEMVNSKDDYRLA
eukprot:CAMPEP_0119003594 /NCGR_PEP_ID=MMETSP1176-20130426/659_1 /TAXON_ID=265551 /ORGANISM="Synedropsis recta cf, Strain CCMP1620" /LENGTH=215 /DNA_ID=CAMNT_0006955211 /DNA_START=75 /DNA_END=722 /DNA_ORIENTATION=-